jgi:hypothetical protein
LQLNAQTSSCPQCWQRQCKRPGVRSARYAGPDASDAENNAKLLHELAGVEALRRAARFVCVLALALPGSKNVLLARWTCPGRIADAPRGAAGFGYDPLFELADGRTMAELGPVERPGSAIVAAPSSSFASASKPSFRSWGARRRAELGYARVSSKERAERHQSDLVDAARIAVVAALWIVACSSGGDFTVADDDTGGTESAAASGAGTTSGSGGSSGSGAPGGSTSDSTGMANGSTSTGSGGDDGSSGSGDVTGAGGADGGTGANGGTGGGPEPSGTPTVLLLVDGSSSMFEAMNSDLAYEALMSPESGVVAEFETRVRFGFMAFHGTSTGTSETDPTCAMLASSDFALDNHAAIDEVYAADLASYVLGTKWETPTGHTVGRAATALDAFSAEPPGRKYILLLTDGSPNTCVTFDPQCGQDVAIRAVQDAYALGIRTLVAGVGDFANDNLNCDGYARCGLDYVQDIANAGVGALVAPQHEYFRNLSCAAPAGYMLVADYGEPAGSAPFAAGTTADELAASLRELLERVVDGEVP